MTYVNTEIADKYQEFFNFMSKEHELILTIEQMDEILFEAQKLVKKLTIPDVVVPKGTLCPSCGEDESIEDWQTYYRCKMCDTKF